MDVSKLTRMLGKILLKTKKISPELCVGGGIVLGGAALVLVGVKTWKGKDILSEDFKAIKEAKSVGTEVQEIEMQEVVENGDTGESEVKPVKRTMTTTRTLTDDEKKILRMKRLDFAKDIVKIYWLPAVIGGSSVVLIWGGRTMLRKELSAATAAYAMLLEKFTKYREKVANEIGAEKEQALAAGYSMEERIDADTGKVEQKIVIDPSANLSQYGFFFNEGYFDKDRGEFAWRNFTWDRDKKQNRLTVIQIEEKYTRLLRTIGYCWLEDLAKDFGLDPEEAKRFHDIGWVWKDGSENRVELGVLETKWQLPVNKGFCDDRCSQNECFINPNVDGYIGYVRDDYRKYDFRYGYGEKNHVSMKRKFTSILNRYDKEMMERMILEKGVR